MKRTARAFLGEERGSLLAMAALIATPLIVLMFAPSEYALWQRSRSHQEAVVTLASASTLHYYQAHAPAQPGAGADASEWAAFEAEMDDHVAETQALLDNLYQVNTGQAPGALNSGHPEMDKLVFTDGDYLSGCTGARWRQPLRFRILAAFGNDTEETESSFSTSLLMDQEDSQQSPARLRLSRADICP